MLRVDQNWENEQSACRLELCKIHSRDFTRRACKTAARAAEKKLRTENAAKLYTVDRLVHARYSCLRSLRIALRRFEQYIWWLIRKIVLLGHYLLKQELSLRSFSQSPAYKRVAILIVAFSINFNNDPVTIAIVAQFCCNSQVNLTIWSKLFLIIFDRFLIAFFDRWQADRAELIPLITVKALYFETTASLANWNFSLPLARSPRGHIRTKSEDWREISEGGRFRFRQFSKNGEILLKEKKVFYLRKKEGIYCD